jgi:hypothetical protein
VVQVPTPGVFMAPGARFCTKCGTAGAPGFCTKCGTVIS